MLAEIRFYSTGWAMRLGVMQLRWNRQENYCGMSLEWLRSSYAPSGGLTWREFRITRAQQKLAAKEARDAALSAARGGA